MGDTRHTFKSWFSMSLLPDLHVKSTFCNSNAQRSALADSWKNAMRKGTSSGQDFWKLEGFFDLRKWTMTYVMFTVK